jgi:hypothetical protein
VSVGPSAAQRQALCFAYFFPIFVGQLIPYDSWSTGMWLGSRWI